MSFTKNYSSFDVAAMIYLGLGLTFSVILIWYVWAEYSRYSSERISVRMVIKYKGPVEEGETILSTDGKIQNGVASTLISIYSKTDGEMASRSNYTPVQTRMFLPVRDECSPLDNTCLSL